MYGSTAGLTPGVLSTPRAGFDRVSGDSPRSAGIGWRVRRDVVARTAGYVDSGATRAVARSFDTAARGMTRSPRSQLRPTEPPAKQFGSRVLDMRPEYDTIRKVPGGNMPPRFAMPLGSTLLRKGVPAKPVLIGPPVYRPQNASAPVLPRLSATVQRERVAAKPVLIGPPVTGRRSASQPCCPKTRSGPNRDPMGRHPTGRRMGPPQSCRGQQRNFIRRFGAARLRASRLRQ